MSYTKRKSRSKRKSRPKRKTRSNKISRSNLRNAAILAAVAGALGLGGYATRRRMKYGQKPMETDQFFGGDSNDTKHGSQRRGAPRSRSRSPRPLGPPWP